MIYTINYLCCLFIYIAFLLSLKGINIYKNNNILKDKVLFVIIGSTTLFILNTVVIPKYRIFPIIISIFVYILFFLKVEIKKSFVSVVYLSFIMISYQILIAFHTIIASLITNHKLSVISELGSYNLFYTIIVNIFFALFLILISYFPKVNKIVNKFYNYCINYKNTLFMILSFFINYSLYEILISYNVSVNMALIFIVLLIIIIYVSLDNMNSIIKYNETSRKYDSSLNDLSKCEEIIDKYRVDNHENKNQLQLIRTMIKQKDRKVEEYIDNLVDTVYMENEKLMMDLSILQSGIRATIYTKLITMINKHIKYNCYIDRKLRDVDEINNSLSLKVCNIISVFIDNAIDEVSDKEEYLISIDVVLENDNYISYIIKNTVENINIDSIYLRGYTTKENGHGYGLSYAKELIESEEALSNDCYVKDNVFTQKLSIKI